jgi:diguanylate cyclase (GGDEF)-like protein
LVCGNLAKLAAYADNSDIDFRGISDNEAITRAVSGIETRLSESRYHWIKSTFRRAVTLLGGLACVVAPASPAGAIDRHTYLPQCRLDIWTVRDGLPSRDINAIVQTPDGFIWLGTSAGLIRFDGNTFDTFNTKNTPGLTSNEITALGVDRDGTLWVGTNWGGFGTFDQSGFHRILPDITHWNVTFTFHQARDGSMWVGANGDNRLYHVVNGKLAQSFRLQDPVIAIEELPDGEIICGDQSNGVTRIVGDNKGIDYLRYSLPSSGLNDMLRTRDGALWLGSQHNGLYHLENGRLKFFTVKDGLASNVVRKVYEDRSGVLWIGTNNGISRWDGIRFVNFDKSAGLSDSEVRAICEDREGNLWVATGTNLNRFAPTKLNPFSLIHGMALANLNDHDGISSSAAGGVWCATDSGLWFVTPTSARLVPMPSGLPSDFIDGVIEGSDGLVWLIWRSQGSTGTIACIPWRSLLAGSRARLQVLHNSNLPVLSGVAVPGGLIGICQSNSGYQLVTFKGGKVVNQKPIDTGYIFTMNQDPTGAIWVGCEHGLMRIRGSEVSTVTSGMPAGAHVLGIDASNPKEIWVACDHGLGRIREGKWTAYGLGAGLPDKNDYQILHSGDSIWVGSNAGIFKIKIADFDSFDRGQIKQLPSKLYTAGDGLRSFPNLYTSAKTPDGRLWFTGPKGITMVDPKNMADNELAPPVSIESAVSDRTEIRGHGLTRVPPGTGTFQVRFTALTFAAPERVSFLYKLEGFDRFWVKPDGRRSATYTNLPPGRYRFIVKAANNDGVWNETGASVLFEIEPHYYQTAWFKALCVLALIGACALVFYLRSRQIMFRNRELERKVSDRTAELVEANELLQSMHVELASQNDQLQSTQAELEAQNDELTKTQTVLAAANAKLEALATTDGLTGLKNHRAFREQLNFEWERRGRTQGPLSVVLLDVDKFKQYNDTYGHPGGDEVLKKVARLLSEHARDTDFVARYGGEEFVVIAAETDLSGVISLAERLRRAIESAEWPLRAVTASFGVATATLATASASDLVAEADAALYRSKEGGRNRVTHAATPLAQAS